MSSCFLNMYLPLRLVLFNIKLRLKNESHRYGETVCTSSEILEVPNP